MKAQLLKGNCLDRLDELPDACVDLVCADPPYGETGALWDTIIPYVELWPKLYRVLKPKGIIVLTSMQPFSSHLVLSNENDYRYSWYWHKQSVTGFTNAKRQPLRDIEEVCVFYREPGTYNPQGIRKLVGADRHRKNGDIRRLSLNGNISAGKGTMYVQEVTNYPRQLLSIGRDDEKVHPTQKPIGLMSYFIRTYTDVGETVLDFCMGSGTTGVACVHTDRDFIGIEMNARYFEHSQRRIKDAHSPFDSFRVKRKPQRQERLR